MKTVMTNTYIWMNMKRMIELDTECRCTNGLGGDPGKLSSYLAVVEPGWGCPWLGHWLSDLPLFAALGLACLCPPDGRAACPAWSPVSAWPECDQTPLSVPLSPIPPGPGVRVDNNRFQWLDISVKNNNIKMKRKLMYMTACVMFTNVTTMTTFLRRKRSPWNTV